jgi:hypothetical protein
MKRKLNFAFTAALGVALSVALPAQLHAQNPDAAVEAELAFLRARVALLTDQLTAVRIALGELQSELVQMRARPLGPSADLVIGNQRTQSVTIVTTGGSFRLDRKGVKITGDLVDIDGKVIDIAASGPVAITGTTVDVKGSTSTPVKGVQIKQN